MAVKAAKMVTTPRMGKRLNGLSERWGLPTHFVSVVVF